MGKNPPLRFSSFARALSNWTGHPIAFMVAAVAVIAWAVTGPLFDYSDTWQLVINTSTTIVTFLMVFLIQNAQNRDTQAVQLKLDELIRATEGAHNALLNLEQLDEKTLAKYREAYGELADRSRARLKSGQQDIGCPEIKDKSPPDESGRDGDEC
jgi:low affinity Fe/Cu permease